MTPDIQAEVVLGVLNQTRHPCQRACFRQDPVHLVPGQRIVVDRVTPVHDDEVRGARGGQLPEPSAILLSEVIAHLGEEDKLE